MKTTRRVALAMVATAAIPGSSAMASFVEAPASRLGRLGHELDAAMVAVGKAWEFLGDLADQLEDLIQREQGALAVRDDDVALGVPGAERAMDEKARGFQARFSRIDIATMRQSRFTRTVATRTSNPELGEDTITVRQTPIVSIELSARTAEIVAAWDAREAAVAASGLRNRIAEAEAAANAKSEAVWDLIDQISSQRATSASDFDVKSRALVWAVAGVAAEGINVSNLRGDLGEQTAQLIVSILEDARAALA